ncbi:TIGR02594 family protein [Bacteroidota bacterium]
MDKFLQIAFKELGEKELVPGDNPRILQYAKKAGFDWVNEDKTPWCSFFANFVVGHARKKGSGKANARSWLLAGEKADNPQPGDVVVFWRESLESWKGHVGFFLGYSEDGSRVFTLGGNQGDQVSIAAYPADTILGFRRIGPARKKLEIPDGVFKNGDNGNKVKSLQQILNHLGFNCGIADGIFGDATEKTLKKLQSTRDGLTVDGIYGQSTKNYIFSLLNQ